MNQPPNFYPNYWQQNTQPNYQMNPNFKTKPQDSELKKAEQNPESAHYYKNIGNEYFKAGKYEEAIENYSVAIAMNDTESVFFSNRARCYKIIGEFKLAYKDALSAVELDEFNIKGYILVGQMLAELGKEEEDNEKLNTAIRKLTKALSLCSNPTLKAFESEIKKNILRVKKVISMKELETARTNEIETYKYLMDLVSADIKSKDIVDEDKLLEVKQLVKNPVEKPFMEIPDHLCCKITYELVNDPVVTVSGVTYEKAALLEHFKRNGEFDPVTRVPVDPDLVFPNLDFKTEVDLFMEQNPWSFEHKPGETYRDVKF